MRRRKREALRRRFEYRCGYCGTCEVDVGGELTVDHFQPRACGGSDAPDNLVYACVVCNDYKGDYWNPGSPERILHPLHDCMAEHIRECDDGTLQPLTATGRFHTGRLQLNRPQLVLQRRRHRELQTIGRRLAQLEAENEALRRHVVAVEEQIRLLLEDAERGM